MAKARFESYVEERVKELAAPRHAKLQAAYDAEVRKVEEKSGRYLKALEAGVEALVRKIFAKAKADGCVVDAESGGLAVELPSYLENKLKGALGLEARFKYESGRRVWPEGTEVRRAQDALEEFNELCGREARRIVVYKKDLGMKPEAFEKMMAEAAMRINKE